MKQNDTTTVEPNQSWALEWKEFWANKELLYFFTWRNFKIRYKQTILGASWAILRPFILMVVFTLAFNRVGKIPSGAEDIPYPVFSYSGLLFWTYFQTTANQVGDSLVAYQGVIQKIYFPRLLVPISTAITGLVDFFFAFIVYIGILLYYGVSPEPLGVVMLLPLLLLSFVSVLGVGMFMAALNVKYRDVRQALPFLIQIGMFLSPIIYPLSEVPEQFRWVMFINPMTGVIDTMHAAFLGIHPMDWGYLGISIASSLLALVIGLSFFKAREREFADII